MAGPRVIKHVAGPNFITGVATGITMHGPTPDGNLQVTFFHDVAYPLQSDVPTPAEAKAGPKVEEGLPQDGSFEIVRHNIATISLRQEHADALGKALTMITEHRKAAIARAGAEKPRDASDVTA